MWLTDEEDFEDWKDNITLLLGSKGLDDYSSQRILVILVILSLRSRKRRR